MILGAVVLVLLAGVLVVQCFALHVEMRVLDEVRGIAARVQELKNRGG